MLSDHWGLLLSVGYLKSAVSTPITFNGTLYSVEDNRLEYSIAPAVRYYSMINEATYFFLQGTVFLSRGTSDADELDNNNKIVQLNSKTSGFGVSISPGISYFLTKQLTTEIAIGVLG